MNVTSLEDLCRKENPSHELYLRYVSMTHSEYDMREKYAFTRGFLWLFLTMTKNEKFYTEELHTSFYLFLSESKQLRPALLKKIFKQMKKQSHRKLRHLFGIEQYQTAAFYGMLTLYSMIDRFKDNRESDDLIGRVIQDIVEAKI